MGSVIYCDLDETLGYSLWRGPVGHEALDEFVVRPGAAQFLASLSSFGTPILLTLADKDYAREAMSRIGPDLVADIIARQDLEPVSDQVWTALAVAPRRRFTARDFQALIPPIYPKGVIFDNAPVGSEYQLIKSTAVDAPDSWWIQVPEFDRMHPDAGGLRWALGEFEARFGGGPTLMGRKMRVIA